MDEPRQRFVVDVDAADRAAVGVLKRRERAPFVDLETRRAGRLRRKRDPEARRDGEQSWMRPGA